ncbi:MAG: hypothetical protein IT462_05105 [Planctomycetes bacterium]|nr:hypothetical protein [Planctomycetota bacterium]
MTSKALRFLFEGGAGLAVEGMSAQSADAAREAYGRFIKGQGEHMMTLVVPGDQGQDEFIIDLRKVVALHIAVGEQNGR